MIRIYVLNQIAELCIDAVFAPIFRSFIPPEHVHLEPGHYKMIKFRNLVGGDETLYGVDVRQSRNICFNNIPESAFWEFEGLSEYDEPLSFVVIKSNVVAYTK